jgi:fatty acid desaturase
VLLIIAMELLDHRRAIAALDPTFQERLLAKSDGPGLARLAFHAGSILLLGLAIALGVQGWPLLLPLQGILIVFLFTLLHETLHETPFRTRALNASVGAVTGFALALGPTWFRYFHFAHHRYTHDPSRDPELASPKPRTLVAYVKHVSGIPFWIANARGLIVNALGRNADPFVPERGRSRVALEARLFLAGYVLLAVLSAIAGSAFLLWTWIVPALLGQPFLRLYLLAEHTDCPQSGNMFENTRTTFTTRLVRLIAWNMPYHAEHHALPTVPFHKLPELHEAVRAHLLTTANGYARFNGELLRELTEKQAA